MPESVQHQLDRVRPPRVQITYDVETRGAIVTRELPLVVGVMADLSGNPEEPLPRLKDRKFVEIDRDNFNDVLKAAKPRLTLNVPNRLPKATAPTTGVTLTFEKLDDFEPFQVLKQVESLKPLFAARQRLNDLLGKLDGNDALTNQLREVAGSPDNLKQLASPQEKTNG